MLVTTGNSHPSRQEDLHLQVLGAFADHGLAGWEPPVGDEVPVPFMLERGQRADLPTVDADLEGRLPGTVSMPRSSLPSAVLLAIVAGTASTSIPSPLKLEPFLVISVQVGYFSNDRDVSCKTAGDTVLTVAGPLNYVGVNPKVACRCRNPRSDADARSSARSRQATAS
jgi:hypothetical protein